MQIRTDVKRAFTDILAADNWVAAFPKMVVFLMLFSAWKVLWNVHITGQQTDGLVSMVLNGFVECLPFLIFAYYAGIKQIRILQTLSLRSRKDLLTGLNNRQTFLENAKARIHEERRGVLLLIDADFFKQVNDTYGHAIGDNCIEAIGHRLHWNLSENDVGGRMGGEEFAILLHGMTTSQAICVAGRIGMPISFSSGVATSDLSITLSIGLVDTRETGNLDDLLIMADDALYDAKRAGRAKLAQWSGGSSEVIRDLCASGPIDRNERRKLVA